jgi:intracellular sulfur oxidation DsrE/DsrF family protein
MSRQGLAIVVGTCLMTLIVVWQISVSTSEEAPARIQFQKGPVVAHTTDVMIKREAAGETEGNAVRQAQGPHRLVLQVNSNDPAMMNLTLNNAVNVAKYYADRGEKAKIEVVTFGPGLHMLREDTSPVKDRIETLALSTPEISFKACGNTRENMSKAENKEIPILSGAEVVKSGVVHVMELQEKGWSYVKP